METPTELVPVALDQGIDVSVSEQGQGSGAAGMVNIDFGAKAEVRPRGVWEMLSPTAAVNVAPGLLLPAPTVPVHRRSSTLPLEVACVARAATSARVVGVQAATNLQYTLMALTCRDQSATLGAGDDPNNYIDLIMYDGAGAVVGTAKVDPGIPTVDVRVTPMVTVGDVTQFFLTYVYPSGGVLWSRIVQFVATTGVLTVGSSVALFSIVPIVNWATSVHAVELDSTGLQLVVFTTSSGTLRYRVVDGFTGSLGAPVNTGLANTNYPEMASCHADGIITILTGYSASVEDIGIYSFNDVTLTVSTHFKNYPTLTLTRRLAVVPDDAAGSGNVIAFVELTNGVDAVLVSATLGVLSSMGEMQSVRLADAGTWIEEDELTAGTGQHRVPLIGLTSSEAVKSNFRSHVVARVFLDPTTAVPRLSIAAILAHSDAGVMWGRYDFAPPGSRNASLPRYAFSGGPIVSLPVMVVSRTTADRTVEGDGAVDPFDRSIRLTTVTSQASAHRGVVTLGPNTYIGGSVPSSWDGESLTPIGFPLPPHTVKVADNGATASGLDVGTYRYSVRQDYQDRQGTIFDSPVMFLGASAIANSSGHTPKLTLFPSALWANMSSVEARSRFATEVFRNPNTVESGDTTFRKAFTISHGPVEAPQTIVDTRADFVIATGELLPDLNSGEITSGPLPALNHLWGHRSRLFGVDAFDRELVRFTTDYAAPTAPRWNDALSVRVTNSGGPVYAGASLADKCVVFQENQICVMSGEGPDGTGRGTFSYPESLRGVGCRPGSQGAVVEVPTGVMFVHQTGIYHLGFDLALTPVGAKLVERIAEPGQLAPISRAVYLASRAQVWFLTDGSVSGQLGQPDVLVWDVTRSRWTAFSSSYGPFSDAIETPGGVYLMDTRGRLLEAHRGSNLHDLDEDGNLVTREMSVLLPWFRSDNAHQIRLRKLHVSGTNQDATAHIEATITTHNESRGSAEDSVSVKSFDMDFQASGNFQATIRAVTQRCHSVQCKLAIISDEETPDDSQELRLSVLAYEVSVLPGTGKTPVSKRPA